MILRALLLSTLVAITASQNCSVCGDGLKVGNPGAVFAFPGQPVVPCGLLQQAGESGEIPVDECYFLPGLIMNACACEPLYIEPTVPYNCSVCGEGMKVGISDGIFAFPGQPVVPCGLLQQAGEFGEIPENECGFLPALISTDCGCEPLVEEPTIPHNCSVCGEGMTVGDPDGIFSFPDQPTVNCGVLQRAGEDGAIPANECSFLPSIIANDCSCELIYVEPPKSEACSVCGDGMQIGDPDGVLSFPDQAAVPCGLLQQAGDAGWIQAAECLYLNAVVKEPCACEPVPESCSICGDGMRVGDPDGIFILFMGQSGIPCVMLQEAGEAGLIPLVECSSLPAIVSDDCSCEAIPTTITPVETQVESDSPIAPIAPNFTAPPVEAPRMPAPVAQPTTPSTPIALPTTTSAPVVPPPTTLPPVALPTTLSPIVSPTAPSPVASPTTPPIVISAAPDSASLVAPVYPPVATAPIATPDVGSRGKSSSMNSGKSGGMMSAIGGKMGKKSSSDTSSSKSSKLKKSKNKSPKEANKLKKSKSEKSNMKGKSRY